MTTIVEKLASSWIVAEKLNTVLWGRGVDPAAMSVEQFADIVTDEYGVQVEFRVVDVETKYVYGWVERYNGGKSATIFLAEHIGSRWRRLVGVKELCQIVLDTEEDFSTDAEDTLARLVTPILELDHAENIVVRSEYLAETLAYELMYPHEFRKADKAKLEEKTVTVSDLGAKYGIPGPIVQDVLAGPYMQFAERWWSALYANKAAGSKAPV